MSFMKRVISAFIMLTALSSSAFADHNVQFTYDNGGNRLSRAIVLVPLAQTRSAETEESDSTQQQPFTDIFADFILKVYPNPTEGHLKIELEGLPEGETFSYVIVSSDGKTVVYEKTTENPSEADLSACNAGLYILKLFYKKETKEFKIIKL